MVTYYDLSRPVSLPFTLIISHILVDIGFEIDQALNVPGLYALINESSWSMHMSHVPDCSRGRAIGRDPCNGARSTCVAK